MRVFLFLIVLSPFLDVPLARFCYTDGHFISHPFFDFFYNYGEYPALITFYGAVCTYMLSFVLPKWKKVRLFALYLMVTLAVGAFFINEKLLKEQWGRPRPRQVAEFGGRQEYRPFFRPNFFHQPEPSKSFACGHCTAGFYFFALARLALRLNKRRLYILSMALAYALGTLLGITRIAQGGHFFSDVLFGALLMWGVAYAFDKFLFEPTRQVA